MVVLHTGPSLPAPIQLLPPGRHLGALGAPRSSSVCVMTEHVCAVKMTTLWAQGRESMRVRAPGALFWLFLSHFLEG